MSTTPFRSEHGWSERLEKPKPVHRWGSTRGGAVRTTSGRWGHLRPGHHGDDRVGSCSTVKTRGIQYRVVKIFIQNTVPIKNNLYISIQFSKTYIFQYNFDYICLTRNVKLEYFILSATATHCNKNCLYDYRISALCTNLSYTRGILYYILYCIFDLHTMFSIVS